MVIVHMTRSGGAGPQRFAYAEDEVSLRNADGANVAVRPGLGDLSEHHIAFVSARSTGLLLHGFNGSSGVFVNGQRRADSHWLAEGDEVRVRLFRFRFTRDASATNLDGAPYIARDATEQALLREVAAHDPTARVVYADWLEQHGDPVRAELLRVQDQLSATSPEAPDFAETHARLNALAAQVHAGWRLLVASPAIERCGVQFSFRCPKQWDRLEPTARDDVRHCGACQRDVYYTLSVAEARSHARVGDCVALDVTSARWDGDLDGPYRTRSCERCDTDLGEHYPSQICAHCGFYTRPRSRQIMMGAIA